MEPKKALQENADSDHLNQCFELKNWSANLTISRFKLPNLLMIILIFDRLIAFFLGNVYFLTLCICYSITYAEG